MGLQEYPKLKNILELAAPPTDEKIRSKALKYFIDNFEGRYSKDYNSADVDIAFLPCSDPDIYAKPLERFISTEFMIMKFQAIRSDLRFQVERFGVCQHPGREKLLNSLIHNPPRYENARAIFEYLASRQTNFIKSDWDILADLEFIPIRDKFRPGNYILTNPHSCFFKVQEEYVLYYFYLYISHSF